MSQTLLKTKEDLIAARQQCWEEHLNSIRNNPKTKEDFESRRITYKDVAMRFYLTKKGNPGPNGYPVYIALHGGGGSPTPDMNDSQWKHQETYYFNSVSDGICVAPRGIRDTWNTHFNEESYLLYDRLIADLAAFEDIDLNRVYLMGFSAGGDGVYGITPFMPDRFAAANMSAGHPNFIDLTNLYNLPLQLQVGENDRAYGRHVATAHYGIYLDRLATRYKGGYNHRVFIHYQKPHNFRDNEPNRLPQTVIADYKSWLREGNRETMETNTNAIDFVNQFTRDPLPKRVVWNMTTRALSRDTNSYYWLWADSSAKAGQIVASYDPSDNSITIEELTTNGDIQIWVNEDMLDVFSPITVRYPDKVEVVTVQPSLEMIQQSTKEREDKNYQFCASILLNM